VTIPITQQELEKRQTARSWEPWVRAKIKEIGVTSKGKTAVRLRQGLAKELLEEAFPMAVFASSHYGKSRFVWFRQYIGNQNYDATVRDYRLFRRLPIKFLEVTQARLGEDEYLRAMKLDETGSVSVYGQLTKKGNKQTGIKIHVKNEMVRKEDTINQKIKLIETAIERKVGKNYPANTALIVVFDGYPTFSDPADVEKIRSMINTKFSGELTEFCWLSVICLSGEIKLDFELPLQPNNSLNLIGAKNAPLGLLSRWASSSRHRTRR
jgi:hypothetical protein